MEERGHEKRKEKKKTVIIRNRKRTAFVLDPTGVSFRY